MSQFGKITEMTSEEVKKLDKNEIEYISLSSGQIIYIKNKENNNTQNEKEEIDNRKMVQEKEGESINKEEKDNLITKNEEKEQNKVNKELNIAKMGKNIMNKDNKKINEQIKKEKKGVNERDNKKFNKIKPKNINPKEEYLKKIIRQVAIENGKLKKQLKQNRQNQIQINYQEIPLNKTFKIRPLISPIKINREKYSTPINFKFAYPKRTLKNKIKSRNIKKRILKNDYLMNEQLSYNPNNPYKIDTEPINNEYGRYPIYDNLYQYEPLDIYDNDNIQNYYSTYTKPKEDPNSYLQNIQQTYTEKPNYKFYVRPMFKVLSPCNKYINKTF